MNTQVNTIYFDTFVWNRHLHILTFRYASQFKGNGHLFLNVLFLCFSNIVLDVLKSFRLTQKPSKSKKNPSAVAATHQEIAWPPHHTQWMSQILDKIQLNVIYKFPSPTFSWWLIKWFGVLCFLWEGCSDGYAFSKCAAAIVDGIYYYLLIVLV